MPILSSSHRPNRGATLPRPTAEENAHSLVLIDLIRKEITSSDGTISFARFMELALYAPGLGYYNTGQKKFGASGDFVTAPQLGPLFARCLARQCAELEYLPLNNILEIGAGTGALAADLLNELDLLNRLPQQYFILELSADLRARQMALLKLKAPKWYSRINWLDSLPERFNGLIIGNEVLDAMPTERFRVQAEGIQQLCVTSRNDRFEWIERPADDRMRQRVLSYNLPPGYTSEINFAAEAWVRTLAKILNEGVLLLIDYGFPRTEFYHPQRLQGTLMCHYRQRAHSDPFLLVGLQDITAHIEFTALAEAAVENGLDVLGYTSQAAFLLANGLVDFAADYSSRDPHVHLTCAQQINKLTSPAEMGELYKVIGFGRGISKTLSGFQLQDRSARL